MTLFKQIKSEDTRIHTSMHFQKIEKLENFIEIECIHCI